MKNVRKSAKSTKTGSTELPDTKPQSTLPQTVNPFLPEELPGERMDKLMQAIKHKRTIKGLRSAIGEILHSKPADLLEFRMRIGPHIWRGVVYRKRNSLMGTIVSFFDTKLFVVRGYPHIKYSDDSRIYRKTVIAQEKIDGTNLGIFRLPDGTITGKTRLTPSWTQEGYHSPGKSWQRLFLDCPGEVSECVRDLLEAKPDYVVYGELYGSQNQGDFIHYTIPIAFKAFDILDRKTQRFLAPQKAREICEVYNVPFVEQRWEGELTDKNIEKIEFELASEVKEDGVEGWVAKGYFDEDKDAYFAKLKTETIKEQCWEHKAFTIPNSVIRKAMRKTYENYPGLKTVEEYEPHIYDELLEDVTQELLDKSKSKIRGIIRAVLTPGDAALEELVKTQMQDMQRRGIDLENKGHVMSNLASTLGDMNAGTLYRTYQRVLATLEKKK